MDGRLDGCKRHREEPASHLRDVVEKQQQEQNENENKQRHDRER